MEILSTESLFRSRSDRTIQSVLSDAYIPTSPQIFFRSGFTVKKCSLEYNNLVHYQVQSRFLIHKWQRQEKKVYPATVLDYQSSFSGCNNLHELLKNWKYFPRLICAIYQQLNTLNQVRTSHYNNYFQDPRPQYLHYRYPSYNNCTDIGIYRPRNFGMLGGHIFDLPLQNVGISYRTLLLDRWSSTSGRN